MPLEDTLEAFNRLVRAGKVPAVGASNHDAARLRQALDLSAARGLASYAVLQPHFNLLERARFEGPLQDLLCRARRRHRALLRAGVRLLAGKLRKADAGGAARGGAVSRYLEAHGLAVLTVVDAVAADAGATPAQVALAWLAAQRSVAAPIASATSVAQVDELLGAMRLVLTLRAGLAALDAASRTEP